VRATEPLADLARAVLDGAPVDWASAESSASGDERPVIRQLRVLEGLAAVHRREPPNAPTRSWTPEVFTNPALADVPERWGHLKILERIGRGAFGAVYRAWDSRLDREVALKLLPAPRAFHDRASSTIIEEGRLLARVRHANVVTIHGAERIGDQIGLWMELVRGQSLEQLLQRGTTFSAEDAIRIGVEACGAVGAVHAAGLLHRDIKAHNVIRADDGRIVLMDFGAGRELEDSSSSDLTGTPLYLAPEVFRGEPATVQSDLYCLGVLLYHLLTGGYPVQGRTIRDVRAAHERGEQTSLAAARPDLPAALVGVVDRAIAPDLERRYRTAQALAADLDGVARPSTWARRRVLVAAAAILTMTITGLWASGAWKAIGRPAAAPRLAVLPFASLGTATGDETFAVGLTQEIHARLGSLEGLTLISFNSSRGFPAVGRDLQDVRAKLGADLLLEGTILRSSAGTVVYAHLTQVSDGVEILTDTFKRANDEAFAIQDDVAREIVRKLSLKLNQRRRPYQPAADTHFLFLQARALQDRRQPDDSRQAVALFEQVVERERGYAEAWAGIAGSIVDIRRMRGAEDQGPPDPRMQEAALEALRLDDTLAEAHAAIGGIYGERLEWARAEAAFKRALSLNPSLTMIHMEYVLTVLLPMARLDEALRLLDAARERDPISLDVRRVMALVQIAAGRYAEAMESCQWVLDRDPKFPYVREWLGRTLALQGRFDEAVTIFKEDDRRWGYLGYTYAVMGRRADAEALLATRPYRPTMHMMIYAGLGDRDRAFDELTRLVDVNPWRAATWMIRPEIAILHRDPRLNIIRKRLGLPER
jgi:serine/threonine-protein kinase